jgi:hypothetical protein
MKALRSLEFDVVKKEHEETIKKKSTWNYKTIKFFKSNMLTKWIFLCTSKEEKKKVFSEMNEEEKRVRIKRLWIKASLVLYFTKIKKRSNDNNL